MRLLKGLEALLMFHVELLAPGSFHVEHHFPRQNRVNSASSIASTSLRPTS